MDRQSPKADSPAKHAQPLSNSRLAVGTGRAPMVRALGEDDVAQLVHDLRDPLATIALEMYVLDRKLAVGDHSDVRSTSVRIIRNVEFLDRLIENLLDSCCDGGRGLEIARRPTELRALLEQVVDRAVSTRDRHRVVLDAPYPLTLPIDGLRIERVVANLLGNALRHAPRASSIFVQLEAGSLAARISVYTDGPAAPPSEAEPRPEPPRRGPHARGIDEYRLGLCASTQIVEAHGGRLTVDGVQGAGARFSFELPVPPR